MQQSIQDFSAGLRTDLHQSKIPDGACAACQNTLFTKGTVKVRPGFVSHSAAPDETPDLAAGITALAQYVPPDGLGQNTRLVAQFGSLLKATDNAAQTFAAHLDMATTLATTAKVRMQQFGDSLYLVDGVNNAKKMFNVNMWKYRGTPKVNDGAHDPIACGVAVSTTHIFSGDNAIHDVYKYTRTTGAWAATWNLAQVTHPRQVFPDEANNKVWILCKLDGASLPTDAGIVRLNYTTGAYEDYVAAFYGTGADQVGNQEDFAAREVSAGVYHFYVCDNHNNRISVWDESVAYATQFIMTFGGSYIRNPISICTDGNGANNRVYVLDDQMQRITKWDFSGNYVTTFGQDILNGRQPVSIRYITEAALLVVSLKEEGTLLFFTTAGEYRGSLHRRSGRYGGTPMYTYGMAVGGSAWGIYVAGYSETISAANSIIEYYDKVDYAGEEGVVEIVDMYRPTVAPTAAGGAAGAEPFLTAGDYLFTFTAVETGGYATKESIQSPVLTQTVAAVTNRYLDITCDVTGLLNAGDLVYLQCLKPGSIAYEHIQHISYYSGTSVVFRIFKEDLDISQVRSEFVNAPYSGMSNLIEWQSRMVYAGFYVGAPQTSSKDTLHISNLNDPIVVPTATYVDPPDTFGTYVQVGNDGTPITGLAKIGSYLAVFKRQSVWLLSGTTWRNFELAQASSEHGCISHESIAYVSGRLVFLANDSVWSFDGQQFDDLGKNIRPTIDGYTLTQKEKSFAVYDPNNRWYVLFMPSTAALASVPTGHALVFDLRTGAWTRFTVMPGNTTGAAGAGCAIYAPRKNLADATTAFPGVFAGDLYGTVEANIKLFRMFTGLTDLGAAIAWNWWGKEHSLPDPSVYKDIRRVRAQIVEGAPATNTFMGNLRTNGSQSSATDQTLALPEGTQVPMMVRWTPVLLADVSSYQVGFSGSSSTAMEIGGMDVTVNPKGPVV